MLEQRQVGGVEYLALVTELLQTARRQSPTAGLWEAADLQWWWRKDQHPDPEAATLWLDAGKPVAALVNTNWGGTVGVDILRVDPRSVELLEVVQPTLEQRIGDSGESEFEMLIDESDLTLAAVAQQAGFVPTDSVDETAWIDAGVRPSPSSVPDGYVLLRTPRTPSPELSPDPRTPPRPTPPGTTSTKPTVSNRPPQLRPRRPPGSTPMPNVCDSSSPDTPPWFELNPAGPSGAELAARSTVTDLVTGVRSGWRRRATGCETADKPAVGAGLWRTLRTWGALY